MQEQHDWMDVERRSGTYQFGVEEGREQGLEQGLAQGRKAALLEVLFELLAERGITVNAEAEAQIRSCEDSTTLHGWIRRAVHATRLDELFART